MKQRAALLLLALVVLAALVPPAPRQAAAQDSGTWGACWRSTDYIVEDPSGWREIWIRFDTGISSGGQVIDAASWLQAMGYTAWLEADTVLSADLTGFGVGNWNTGVDIRHDELTTIELADNGALTVIGAPYDGVSLWRGLTIPEHMPPAPVLQLCAPNTPPPTSTPTVTNTPTPTTTPTPIHAPPPFPALSDECFMQPMDSYQEIRLLPRPEHYRAWALGEHRNVSAIWVEPGGQHIPTWLIETSNQNEGYFIDKDTEYIFSTGEPRDNLILCPEDAPPPPGETCENPLSIWHTERTYSYGGTCHPPAQGGCEAGSWSIWTTTTPISTSYIMLGWDYSSGYYDNTSIYINGVHKGSLVGDDPSGGLAYAFFATESYGVHTVEIVAKRRYPLELSLTFGAPIDIHLPDIPTDGQYHTVFDACIRGFPMANHIDYVYNDGNPIDSGFLWWPPEHDYTHVKSICDVLPAQYVHPYVNGQRKSGFGTCLRAGGSEYHPVPQDVMFTWEQHNSDACGRGACYPSAHQVTLQAKRELAAGTPSPTPTPPPTATPNTPSECYVQELSPLRNDNIAFPVAKEVYRWYAPIDYFLVGGNNTGRLTPYADGTPLQVQPGQTWNFSTSSPRGAILVCPASEGATMTPSPSMTPTASMTPTPTFTPTATLQPFPVPDECFLVESEYRTDRQYYTRWPASFNLHPDESAVAVFHTADWRFKADAPVSYISNSIATGDLYYASYTYAAETWIELNTAGVGFTSDQAFRMMACPPSDLPTPTMPPSPTLPPSPTPTGRALDPAACVEPITSTQAARLGSVPALAVELPTFEPVQYVTATVVISVSVVSDTLDQMFTGMITPQMQIQTATAGYSWESGQATVQGWAAWLQPALDWLAIVNPNSPAWAVEGTYLWAVSPVLLPLAPLLIAGLVVVVVRYWFWFLDMFQRVIEFIIKLIELIPGM
jgi:hypothetical protein